MKLFFHYMMFFLVFGYVGESFASEPPPPIATVECSQQEDQCYIETMDGERFYVDRQVLPYLVVYDEGARPEDCYFELCYNENGVVTGLNPRHTFFHR
jgi:hypothetical protein